MDRLGFVGLGNVGGPMAINLLKSGFEVIGYDVRPNAAFETAGGRAADDLRDIVTEADVIIHSLPSQAAINASVDALLADGRRTPVLIEMSSYDLGAKLETARRLGERGIAMLDCEVSGLPPQVANRTAVIFKSGDAAVTERLAPVFDGLADKHFYLGPLGAATKMKLIANTMVCVNNLIAAEALNLGARLGLSPEVMIEVLGPSAAGSSTFIHKAPLMVSRQFDNGLGPFRHMFGYLARAKALADDVEVATPLLDVTRRLYCMAEAGDRHDQDIAAIIEIVESLKLKEGANG
jgi:3-hydroxyisobutyrate dehydrogenase-like beta-hydroxyacid dehydrogenase